MWSKAQEHQARIDPNRGSCCVFLFFLFKVFFRVSNSDLLRSVPHLKNLSSDSCLGRKWMFKNVNKIRMRANFFYFGGGAATLRWPATASELRWPTEKMTRVLERSDSLSKTQRREFFFLKFAFILLFVWSDWVCAWSFVSHVTSRLDRQIWDLTVQDALGKIHVCFCLLLLTVCFCLNRHISYLTATVCLTPNPMSVVYFHYCVPDF